MGRAERSRAWSQLPGTPDPQDWRWGLLLVDRSQNPLPKFGFPLDFWVVLNHFPSPSFGEKRPCLLGIWSADGWK